MMKNRLLPHYFKYIGLALFIGFGLVSNINSFISGFTDGFNGNPYNTTNIQLLHPIFASHSFEIIHYLGLLIYALSRDKTFDEYIQKIRMETLSYIFFATLLYILARITFEREWEMSASYLFEVQVYLFLIVNKVRKKLILG